MSVDFAINENQGDNNRDNMQVTITGCNGRVLATGNATEKFNFTVSSGEQINVQVQFNGKSNNGTSAHIIAVLIPTEIEIIE
jgi:hypothetical protein